MANNSISDTTEAAILALVFNATTWGNYAINATTSPETNIVVTLNTAASVTDTDVASTNEATYSPYARVNVARSSTGWTITGTSPTSAVPAAAITFAACTSGTSTIQAFTTGKSGGGGSAILWGGTVSPTIAVSTGVTPQLTTATAITLD